MESVTKLQNVSPVNAACRGETAVASAAIGRNVVERGRAASAIVYCEANFGAVDGKTANGLVRHSERYDILSAIDSTQAGSDAGVVLDSKPNAIPVCRDLADALAHAGSLPDYFIFGMAPASGMLSLHERSAVLEATSHGMNIVNGLNASPAWSSAGQPRRAA